MLSIAPIDTHAARRAMTSRGGFLWWYLDAVDEAGNGCVIIWSYGLPFLPGYASSERRGRAPAARERPSLNVAVYREGALDCYLLQEYDPAQVEWRPEAGTWRFGETEIASDEREGERRVSVALDCPIPGGDERLRGRVVVEGTSLHQYDGKDAVAPNADAVAPNADAVAPNADAVAPNADTAAPVDHRWCPRIVAGEADIDLRAGDREHYRFGGRAYHDANCGVTPFHRLGIDCWLWGRCPVGDREIVFYGLWPDDEGEPLYRVFDLGAGGEWRETDEIDFVRKSARWNLGGMRWWERLELTGPAETDWSPLSVEVRDVVDSGPFYMRFLTRTTAGEREATGVAELIRPHRIDLARHRPLVRMRVQQVAERNSAWLPLFSGPKQGRVRRLFDFNFGGTG